MKLYGTRRLFAQVSGGGGPTWWDPAGEGLCVWSAYQPKGAASYAASKVDLSGNGNDCVDGGAFPTWDVVNGWIFDNAATDILNTAFVPASDQSQSVLVQFTVGDAAQRAICGESDTGAKDFWIHPDGNFGAVTYANGGGISVAPKLANGNLGIAGNTASMTHGSSGAGFCATPAEKNNRFFGCNFLGDPGQVFSIGNSLQIH